MLFPELPGNEVHPLAFARHLPLIVEVKEAGVNTSKVLNKNEPKKARGDLGLECLLLATIVNEVVETELRAIIKPIQLQQEENLNTFNDVLNTEIIKPEMKSTLELLSWKEFANCWKNFENSQNSESSVVPKLSAAALEAIEKLGSSSITEKQLTVAMETLKPWNTTPWNRLLRCKSVPLRAKNTLDESDKLKKRILSEICAPIVTQIGATVMEKDLERLDKEERLQNPPRYI